jgi:hypothetical protein
LAHQIGRGIANSPGKRYLVRVPPRSLTYGDSGIVLWLVCGISAS